MVAILCTLIGDPGSRSRAQETSGVFAPSFDDYLAASDELHFQVSFETAFETIPSIAIDQGGIIQTRTTNGFSASFPAGLVQHPMNAGLRNGTGDPWVVDQAFAMIRECPAFAFSGGVEISFARNSAADGTGKWIVETVVPSESLPGWLDGITLLPLQNAPLIAFRQSEPDPASTNGGQIYGIKFAIASDGAGQGPWKIVPSGLNDPENYNLLSNFELASNRVIVAFLDQDMTSLFLATAPAALDGSAWEIAPIITSSAPLSRLSVAVIDGKIMLTYAVLSSDGDAHLYLTEATANRREEWQTTQIGSVPADTYFTALSAYDGEILASYSYLVSDWYCPGIPFPCIPGQSTWQGFGIFVSAAKGAERMWRQFDTKDSLFGRWSTVQGRPVISLIKAADIWDPVRPTQLGLLVVPEVHWRATAGPQLSITRRAEPPASTFDLSLVGIPGHAYELFWKESIDGPEWVSIGRASADDYGHISTFHQTTSSNGFYRAVEVPAPQ